MENTKMGYYWMINTRSYSVDGIVVLAGEMTKQKKGGRAIVNNDWRLATKSEVKTKNWSKGTYFNLMNF